MLSVFIRRLTNTTAATALIMAAATAQGDTSQSIDLDIKEKSLSGALTSLADKFGLQIGFFSDFADQANPVTLKGNYTATEALDALLQNTTLSYNYVNDTSVAIKSKSDDEEGASEEQDAEKKVDEEIIVTGSRISGKASQIAANVIVWSREDLLASGEATLADALRKLPQNVFGATPNGGAAVSGSGVSFNGALNVTGASSVNLRGLGSEATLILVDGQRIGKAGLFGGISDISNIPMSAIDRVEILLDGGTSMYGSDAVGGVVNVITRKDYEGGDITYRYATPQKGGYEEHVFSLTGGHAWDSGRLQATFERYHQTNLDGAERPEPLTTSFTRSYPGKILFVNFYRLGNEIFTINELREIYTNSEIDDMETSGQLVRQEANLPAGHNGLNLTRDDLVFTDRTNGGMPVAPGYGISLRPKTERSTLMLRVDQELQLFGQPANFSSTLKYTQGNVASAEGGFLLAHYAYPRSPFNDNSPMPDTFFSVSWILPEFADRHYYSENENRNFTLGLSGGDVWRWNISANHAWNTSEVRHFNDALRPWSAEYEQLLAEGFNPFAGDLYAANSPEMLQRLIVDPWDALSVNEENTADAYINGTLFDLPGGSVFASLGVGWRQEVLETGSRGRVTQSGGNPEELGAIGGSLPLSSSGFDDVELSRTQRSAYAELLVPVVGADNALPAVRSLILSGQARYDSYHEQGSDSTWALSLVWSPVDQLKVTARRDTSYVVPTLSQGLVPVSVFDYVESSSYSDLGRPLVVVDENDVPTGELDYIGLSIAGGNPNLKPQTGSVLTAGIEFEPDIIPGFTVGANWYENEFNNRIGAAPRVEELRYRYFSTPDGFAQGFYPSEGYETRYGSSFYRREDGRLVTDSRAINIGSSRTTGIDYTASYNRDTEYGHFLITANVNRPISFVTIPNPSNDPINHLDEVAIASNSVVPVMRYSTHVTWGFRGFTTAVHASTSSSTVSEGRLGFNIIRRTTDYPLDMALSVTYDTAEGDLFTVPAWMENTRITLQIPRLLSEVTEYTAQRINTISGQVVDMPELNSQASDPIGRMFRLSVTKRF